MQSPIEDMVLTKCLVYQLRCLMPPRTGPFVVATRLSQNQLSHVAKAAAAHGSTVAAFTRCAVLKLASGNEDDPQGVVKDLILALGLSANASGEEILRAVTALVAEIGASESKARSRDGLNESADPPPHALSSDRERSLQAPGGGFPAPPAADYRATPAEIEAMRDMDSRQASYFLACRAERARQADSLVSVRKAQRDRRAAFDEQNNRERRAALDERTQKPR
jgi:hypothetical protein